MSSNCKEPSAYLSSAERLESAYEKRDECCVTEKADRSQIRPIEIRQLNHGYVVKIECHSFAVENPTDLIAKLANYILNPGATESLWFDKKFFK